MHLNFRVARLVGVANIAVAGASHAAGTLLLQLLPKKAGLQVAHLQLLHILMRIWATPPRHSSGQQEGASQYATVGPTPPQFFVKRFLSQPAHQQFKHWSVVIAPFCFCRSACANFCPFVQPGWHWVMSVLDATFTHGGGGGGGGGGRGFGIFCTIFLQNEAGQ